jgi:RNase P/RNase MRP subunit POP5
MRRNIPAIFVISTLIVLVLCSACVSQPTTNQKSQQNVGLTQISEESPYISFDVAHQNLREYRSDLTNESTVIKTVYYIHGTNVDGSGNATSWIFGVRHSGGTGLLAYDRSGWKQIPWNASLLSEEIDVDRIVSPGSLFSQNNAVILSNSSPTNPERRDLDLIRGIYTLTITSGSKDRIITFNATTGVLIP